VGKAADTYCGTDADDCIANAKDQSIVSRFKAGQESKEAKSGQHQQYGSE